MIPLLIGLYGASLYLPKILPCAQAQPLTTCPHVCLPFAAFAGGLGARLANHFDPYTIKPFVAQQVIILACPCFFLATSYVHAEPTQHSATADRDSIFYSYLVLDKLQNHLRVEKCLLLPAKWVVRLCVLKTCLRSLATASDFQIPPSQLLHRRRYHLFPHLRRRRHEREREAERPRPRQEALDDRSLDPARSVHHLHVPARCLWPPRVCPLVSARFCVTD